MPLRLAPCDLGDPGWGIPGFRMVICCFTHPLVWLDGLDVFLFVSAAIPWRDDIMLSPLALINQNWHRSRRRLVCLLCVLLFSVLFAWFFAFGFCYGLFVLTSWRPTGLCTGPYQFTLEAPQPADGHVYALINYSYFCNMQLNVLNNLAEAMKALDGKKLPYNPWGAMLSSLRASSNCLWTDQLTTSRALVFCFCVWLVLLLFGVFVCFVCFGFGVCFLSCTVTAEWICVNPIQVSFASHCHYEQSCHCINLVNLSGWINDLARAIWHWTEMLHSAGEWIPTAKYSAPNEHTYELGAIATLQVLDDDDDPLKSAWAVRARRNCFCASRIGWRFSLMRHFLCAAQYFCERWLGPAGSHCLGMCPSPLRTARQQTVSMTLPRYWRQRQVLLFQDMMTDAWKAHVREIWGGFR